MNALGQLIDMNGVVRIYHNDKRTLETEIERRLQEHDQVLVYELVKATSVSRISIDEVTVYEYGEPFSDIGTIMNIEYNLSSQGFRMKLENIELEGVQDTRVKRYRIEV